MLIDTSGWLCSLDDRDKRHKEAKRIFESARRLITHSYVISELVPLCEKRRFSRSRTLRFIDELLGDPTVDIIWVDLALTRSSNALLRSREDKNWSLCDAVSFLIMESEGIVEALTTDHHFEQAGFVKLLDS
jgi:predicted nucleic acid-binding protein